MKKFLLACAAFATAATMFGSELQYEATGVSYFCDSNDEEIMRFENIPVEVYDDCVIVKSWAGVEGYNFSYTMSEEEDEYGYNWVTSFTRLCTGYTDKTYTSGYGSLYSGVEGMDSFQPYISSSYTCASLWDDEEYGIGGFVELYGYLGSEYVTLTVEFEKNEAPVEKPIASYLGEVGPSEGWGETLVPEIKDVAVDAYEDYFIIRGFAGVEGYDLKVALKNDGADGIASLTSIVNGVEAEPCTSGYCDIPTGREDVPVFQPYVGVGYLYAGYYGDEEDEEGITSSGYAIISGNYGDWTYYYFAWPQDGDDEGEWENPFERESQYLYSAVAHTTSEPSWGESLFPEVTDINVGVYDNYIYINAFAGVAGYDLKVAYNEDDQVLSFIEIINGEEGTPCKTYTYLETGREDYPTLQAYCTEGSSYAGTDEQEGYALISGYLYTADGALFNTYYMIEWLNPNSGIESVTATDYAPAYNVFGQRVEESYKGIIIKGGKKYLNR